MKKLEPDSGLSPTERNKRLVLGYAGLALAMAAFVCTYVRTFRDHLLQQVPEQDSVPPATYPDAFSGVCEVDGVWREDILPQLERMWVDSDEDVYVRLERVVDFGGFKARLTQYVLQNIDQLGFNWNCGRDFVLQLECLPDEDGDSGVSIRAVASYSDDPVHWSEDEVDWQIDHSKAEVFFNSLHPRSSDAYMTMTRCEDSDSDDCEPVFSVDIEPWDTAPTLSGFADQAEMLDWLLYYDEEVMREQCEHLWEMYMSGWRIADAEIEGDAPVIF